MSYYRTLTMSVTKEKVMSVKLQPNMTQSPYDIKICEDLNRPGIVGDSIF